MEIPQPGKETAERILQWLSLSAGKPETIPPIDFPNAETQPVVETAQAETTVDEVTPEEIHCMREAIKAHLKNGSFSQEQYRKWRIDHNIGAQERISDLNIVLLTGTCRFSTRAASGARHRFKPPRDNMTLLFL